MGRVVLFKGVSDYLSLNTMVEGLAAAFGRRGFSPAILDMAAADYPDRIRATLAAGDTALFVSLNGIGLPREGGTFFDRRDEPVVALFVDHPIYHLDRLSVRLPNLHFAFPSRSHVAFCRPLRALHLPHAAEFRSPTPWAARDISVLYCGSPLAADPEAQRAGWRAHGARAAAALEAIVAAHDIQPREPLETVVARILGRPPEDREALRPFFLAADAYLRSRIKVAAIAALADAGIATTVCGRGWEGLSGRLRLLGSRTAPETFALMDRSRLVLNLLPPYYESHERVFQAMASGAVAATTPSDLWDETGGLLSLPYEPKALAAALADALADDDRLAATAGDGRAIFLAGHTWDHRVDAILAFLAGERGSPVRRAPRETVDNKWE
ncbi:MAG: glycosyltransferase [Magnetospirillum sp. WYHS-4]